MGLNAREEKFVEVYAGNGTEAARLAGYKGNDNVLAVQARRLLRKAQIQAAIAARNEKASKADIASREERQAFWTKAMKEEANELRDRLKASELLGRSEADFTDKQEHSGALAFNFTMAKKGAAK